ncbi:MAG TPA: SDR family NAD(P)-dependent oxidoreductase [Thermoplasmata archaeon]|jgi:NAD(P)-dependent dehydrogenase (short-subunit alcohol dehydrogenase family)|nr:SDR family NAD(P)-dependent oxidoreductase [Thermoplasmata archaeon]
MVDETSERPIALVTGANRGLGLETARQLLADGYRVVLTSRDEAKGIAAAQQLDAGGRAVQYHKLDVTDRKSITALARDLPGLVPRLDVLVNNAGIGSWGGDRRLGAQTIATNYFGTRDVTDALVPFLRRGGRIINVSSGLGELSYLGKELRAKFEDPSLARPALDAFVASYLSALEVGKAKGEGWPSSYSVSKIAINALTRILARDLSAKGITVNSVCPGWVRTDMGGPGASRSVPVGARSILLAVKLPPDATGGFYRDGRRIAF